MISKTILNVEHDDLQYAAGEGWFFLYSKAQGVFSPSGPLTCRDEFRWDWEGEEDDGYDCGDNYSSHRVIGFSLGGSGVIDVTRFAARWARLEGMAGVEVPSIIYRTQNAATIIIKLSPFWVQHTVHRSLATLLIRMVGIYWNTGLHQAIADYKWAHQTKRAIMWFLRGNTKATFNRFNDEWKTWEEKYRDVYDHEASELEPDTLTDNDNHCGWVGEFAKASPADIRRKLVRP